LPVAESNARRPSSTPRRPHFLSKDDCQNALPYFSEATESTAAYGEHGAGGFCNEKLGHHADAIESFRKSSQHSPSAESYFNIGLANYYLSNTAKSEQAYCQAIKLDPTTPRMHITHWVLLIENQAIRRRNSSYKQALKLKSDYGPPTIASVQRFIQLKGLGKQSGLSRSSHYCNPATGRARQVSVSLAKV